MNYSAVLWDMDGTLIDSEPLHFEVLVQVLADVGLTCPAGLQKQMIGRSSHAVHALLVERLKLTLDHAEFMRRKYDLYLRNASTLRGHESAVALYQKVLALGCPQVIVSNSDRMLVEANILALGLRRPDLLSVTRNDVRHGKPDAEPYLRGAWLAGVDPSACAVVEDSPSGAAAGLAAGMTVFVLPEAGIEQLPFPEQAIMVADADQLAELLGLPENSSGT